MEESELLRLARWTAIECPSTVVRKPFRNLIVMETRPSAPDFVCEFPCIHHLSRVSLSTMQKNYADENRTRQQQSDSAFMSEQRISALFRHSSWMKMREMRKHQTKADDRPHSRRLFVRLSERATANMTDKTRLSAPRQRRKYGPGNCFSPRFIPFHVVLDVQ